ncbi:hypothetical protein FACS1894196_4070 [Clostridia bacterium]|nr:hypothetical protein FACS1894196_4070 [Clostridia bacterium]
MDFIKSKFKSKEQKALEAKIAVRQGVQELKRCSRVYDKKRDEMIKYAQSAKQQGLGSQYKLAVSGLKMVMAQAKRTKAMILQLEMTESLRDLTTMSSKFVSLLSGMAQQIQKVATGANFAQNQMAFQKGLVAADSAMDQLEQFMESAGMGFEDMSDGQDEVELDEEIERLLEGKADPIDDEIEQRIKASEVKRDALKE